MNHSNNRENIQKEHRNHTYALSERVDESRREWYNHPTNHRYNVSAEPSDIHPPHPKKFIRPTHPPSEESMYPLYQPISGPNLFKLASIIKTKLRPLSFNYKTYSESFQNKHIVYFNAKDSTRVNIEISLVGEEIDLSIVIYQNSEELLRSPLLIPEEHRWDLFVADVATIINQVSSYNQAISEVRKFVKEHSFLREIGNDLTGVDLTFGDNLDVIVDFNIKGHYINYEVSVGRETGEEFDCYSFYYNRDPKVAITKAVDKARKFVSRMFHLLKKLPQSDDFIPSQSRDINNKQVESDSGPTCLDDALSSSLGDNE